MELRHLRYFLAVAEDLHFGRAAARLHVTQPPLSRQIRNLETELGVTLFHRTRRRVQLTQAGQLFLEAARRVLTDVEEAVRAAQQASRGEIGQLLIGFVGTATCDVLVRPLRVFRERFPEVTLCLQELTTVQQVKALHEKRLDVGFLRPPIEDESLSLMVLTREPFVVAVSATHRLSRQPQVPLRRLAGEAFVLFPRQAAPGFYDQIIRLCQRAGFSPNITQEASQIHALLGFVAAGLGVSLLPASMQYLQGSGVVYRALRPSVPQTGLAVAWRHDHSPVVDTFLTVVRECSPPMATPERGTQ